MENLPPPLQKQIILVLGMHRSGTSALTRVINLKGIPLPANLMPPVEGVNDTGFWESDDIVALHEKILTSIGLSWQSVEPFPEGWFTSPLATPFKAELKSLLAQNLENHHSLVIKDPRTSRMIPLWKEVAAEMDVALFFVIAIRNPLEVAASLKARSGFSYQPEGLSYGHSFQLWLRYFLEAEYHTRRDKRVLVSYEQLMEDWHKVIARIEQEIGMQFPCNDEETSAEISCFISESHRHHHSNPNDLGEETEASDTLKNVYRAASDLTQGKKTAFTSFDVAREGPKPARNKNLTPFLKQAAYYLSLGLIEFLPDRFYVQYRNKLLARSTHMPVITLPATQDNKGLVHYLQHGREEKLSPHPLFDLDYYLKHNPDIAATAIDPFLHFLISGAKEGRNPHPLFDIAYYVEQHPELAASGVNPLLHFLASPHPKNPHPLFDIDYYLKQNPSLDASTINPLVHFITTGAKEGFSPYPLFDIPYYLHTNPDVASSGMNPLIHFVLHGLKEGRNPHPLFDTLYYLYTNPYVAAHQLNPLLHFMETGAFEGRNPHPLFDIAYYLEHNKDVAEAQLNPLLHFISSGAYEGRTPNRLFDSNYYLAKNPDVRNAGLNPLAHYIAYGADEGRNPHLLFDTRYYAQQLNNMVKV